MREASCRTLGLESESSGRTSSLRACGLGEQRPEGRDRGVLDPVGVVAAVLEQRTDVRLVGVLREDLDGAEAQLLVVVVEGMQRDRRAARGEAVASTIANAFLRSAGAPPRSSTLAIHGSARSFGFLRR